MFKYKCHIREVRKGESTTSQCHFVHDDMQFFDHNGTIKVSASTNFQTDVKLIVLSRLESQENLIEEVGNFPTQALNSIRKKHKKSQILKST